MSSITLGKCIKYSNRVCFSPNGELIAYAKGPSLFVMSIYNYYVRFIIYRHRNYFANIPSLT